jgi:hypothetical protein
MRLIAMNPVQGIMDWTELKRLLKIFPMASEAVIPLTQK